MPIWIAGAVAAIAGILVGFWLRSASAKAQSAAFEALATEREKTAAGLREELQGKSESERNLAARVSGLEAELRNERQNLAEKLALLVVGNGPEIKPGLDELNLGPAQPIDITIPMPRMQPGQGGPAEKNQ